MEPEPLFFFISMMCAPDKVSDAFDELSEIFLEQYSDMPILFVQQALASAGEQVVLSLLFTCRAPSAAAS